MEQIARPRSTMIGMQPDDRIDRVLRQLARSLNCRYVQVVLSKGQREWGQTRVVQALPNEFDSGPFASHVCEDGAVFLVEDVPNEGRPRDSPMATGAGSPINSYAEVMILDIRTGLSKKSSNLCAVGMKLKEVVLV